MLGEALQVGAAAQRAGHSQEGGGHLEAADPQQGQHLSVLGVGVACTLLTKLVQQLQRQNVSDIIQCIWMLTSNKETDDSKSHSICLLRQCLLLNFVHFSLASITELMQLTKS